MEIHIRTSKISLKCRNFALSSGIQFINLKKIVNYIPPYAIDLKKRLTFHKNFGPATNGPAGPILVVKIAPDGLSLTPIIVRPDENQSMLAQRIQGDWERGAFQYMYIVLRPPTGGND